MRLALCGLVVALAAAGFAGVAAEAQEPPTVIERAPVLYPAAARAAGVEGLARFVATVRNDGTVSSVTILSVPAPNLGFEESVDAAVRRWRFAPMAPGVNRPNVAYPGSVEFLLSLPREWIYPVDSRTAWMHVLAIAKQRRMRFDRRDDQRQLLITNLLTYRGGGFPDTDKLALPLGHEPARIQFHIYVAPGFEPARVAIGSIIETSSLTSADRSGYVVYGNEAASAWFLTQLSAQIGRTPEPLASSAERRAEQSKRLLPAGMPAPCASKPARLVSSADAKSQRLSATALSEVRPRFPQDALDERREAMVLFSGEITEHGTLTNMRHLEPPSMAEPFRQAAQLAGSLWRFALPIVDGCPIRLGATFEMSFLLR